MPIGIPDVEANYRLCHLDSPAAPGCTGNTWLCPTVVKTATGARFCPFAPIELFKCYLLFAPLLSSAFPRRPVLPSRCLSPVSVKRDGPVWDGGLVY